MRKKIHQTLTIPVALLVLFTACGKSYFNVNNNNPNQVTDLPPMTLMAGTLNQAASIVTTDFPFPRLHAFCAPSFLRSRRTHRSIGTFPRRIICEWAVT